MESSDAPALRRTFALRLAALDPCSIANAFEQLPHARLALHSSQAITLPTVDILLKHDDLWQRLTSHQLLGQFGPGVFVDDRHNNLAEFP